MERGSLASLWYLLKKYFANTRTRDHDDTFRIKIHQPWGVAEVAQADKTTGTYRISKKVTGTLHK